MFERSVQQITLPPDIADWLSAALTEQAGNTADLPGEQSQGAADAA